MCYFFRSGHHSIISSVPATVSRTAFSTLRFHIRFTWRIRTRIQHSDARSRSGSTVQRACVSVRIRIRNTAFIYLAPGGKESLLVDQGLLAAS
jgi:hypothetical protein